MAGPEVSFGHLTCHGCPRSQAEAVAPDSHSGSASKSQRCSNEGGADPSARCVIAEGADAVGMSRSIPLPKSWMTRS